MDKRQFVTLKAWQTAGMAVLMLLSFFSLTAAQDASRIDNEYIVMLHSGQRAEQVTATFDGLLPVRCLSPRMNIWLLSKNNAVSPERMLELLKAHPAVKIAQFNHVVQNRSVIPDDTRFTQQWSMLNTGQNSGVVGADIEATEAWSVNSDNVTSAGDTVVIAVIDGKFDLAHEDLNFFINYNEIEGNNIDDDGNGYIDDVQGWNAYDNNGDVTGGIFSASHGTHVCGIAAAKGNNALGVAGVCWGAKLLPIAGSGSDEATVVSAYNYAREMRILYDSTNGTKGAYVVVTNSSFGVDEGNPVNYPLWCAMYDSMGKAGILSACATANDNANVDIVHDIPTECPSQWVIGVTNTTRNDARNGGAAYGALNVDVGAPGTGIHSTIPANDYGDKTGTSMATPHVAGSIAAMYAAACPALINAYKEKPDSIALIIRQYLLESAEWISALNNITATDGRLNLYRAITSLRRFNCDSCNFDISIDKSDISCKGASNGALALGLMDNFTAYTCMWSTGHTALEILNCAPGFYTLYVMDTATGCRRFATAQLHDPDSINITSVNTVPASGGNNGNITIEATAGNELLQYSLDGITYQTSPIFTVSENGTYTVYVKNATGCVATRTVVVSSIEQVETVQLRLYPNPVTDELHITTDHSMAGVLTISDGLGRWVDSVVVTGNHTVISTAGWNDGIYFLHAPGVVKKFSVIH